MSRVRRLLTEPERGSGPAVSAAILMPIFALVLLAVAASGRISNANDATDQAARGAARPAAQKRRDPNLAETAATTAAQAALASKGLSCGAVTVTVNTDGLRSPLGQPSTVTASVSCQVKLAELAFPGLPGDHTVTATFTSPVDPSRERP
jgi:Flp pilus assembly protein TadG